MKNARSNVLRLFAVTIALSSTPIRAETVNETNQEVILNTPEIKVVGKGAKRKNLWRKISEDSFVLRSSPVESNAEVYLFRDNNNYDVLTCRTPCIFKIPALIEFRFDVKAPAGFILVSKPVPIQWKEKLITFDLEPNDITFSFAPQ